MTKATELDQQIGEKIRINRIYKKKTRTWLCKKLKKSYQQVQNYESGKHRIAASMLHAISDLLGVKIENFFPEKNIKKDS
jgi:transcriptional regulator with XRE-family HTH domain